MSVSVALWTVRRGVLSIEVLRCNSARFSLGNGESGAPLMALEVAVLSAASSEPTFREEGRRVGRASDTGMRAAVGADLYAGNGIRSS